MSPFDHSSDYTVHNLTENALCAISARFDSEWIVGDWEVINDGTRISGRSGSSESIGARRLDIVRQFLTESVMISVGGGLLGIAFGFFLAWLIARTAEWKTIVTTASVVIAFGVSVFVGVVFGIYPAVKASRINPIDALRYE